MLDLGHALHRPHHGDLLRDQLERVAVAGQHQRLAAAGLLTRGEGGDRVVGLGLRRPGRDDAERLEERLQVIELLDDRRVERVALRPGRPAAACCGSRAGASRCRRRPRADASESHAPSSMFVKPSSAFTGRPPWPFTGGMLWYARCISASASMTRSGPVMRRTIRARDWRGSPPTPRPGGRAAPHRAGYRAAPRHRRHHQGAPRCADRDRRGVRAAVPVLRRSAARPPVLGPVPLRAGEDGRRDHPRTPRPRASSRPTSS